jgi:hypothetical protein
MPGIPIIGIMPGMPIIGMFIIGIPPIMFGIPFIAFIGIPIVFAIIAVFLLCVDENDFGPGIGCAASGWQEV